jgi:transposase
VSVKRKQHSAEFKARVAMAALSGEKILAELSAEFGVHPTMISNRKQELVKRAGELFGRGRKAPAVADAQKVIDDASIEGALAHFSSSTGIDLSRYDMDEPIRYVKTDAMSSTRSNAG